MTNRKINEKDVEMFHILMQLKEQSKCVDKQVSCIIVDQDYNIVSQGVNTIIDCNKDCHNKRERVCDVTHAEVVAANNLHYLSSHLKAYVSLCPCIACQQELTIRVNEIVYFGMTHRDIDPVIEHKITRFPHLNYEIFSDTNANDFIREIKNRLDNLKESIEYGKEKYVIDQIIETEIEIEQLKLWLNEGNSEFHNDLRNRRNEILKKYIEEYNEN